MWLIYAVYLYQYVASVTDALEGYKTVLTSRHVWMLLPTRAQDSISM